MYFLSFKHEPEIKREHNPFLKLNAFHIKLTFLLTYRDHFQRVEEIDLFFICQDEQEHDDGRERGRVRPGLHHGQAAQLPEGHRVVQGQRHEHRQPPLQDALLGEYTNNIDGQTVGEFYRHEIIVKEMR